jgi:protein TonB
MTCAIDTEPGRGLPELAEDLRPRYPEMLRQAGVSGEVELEYVVLESGRVDSASVRVLASTHPAFSEAAREALQRARFKPAHRGAGPVPVTVRQTLHFVSR